MIRKVLLNRPEKYNALNLEMIERLIREIEARDNTRVLLLQGEGPHFCAGADLTGDFPKIFEGIVKLYHAMITSDKIIIALIDGHCIAGGFGLAAAADLALATPEASFSLPETRRGLVAPLASLLAEHALPKRILHELTLSGEPIKAPRLYDVGFLNKVVSREDLQTAAEALAQHILKGGPEATRLTKKLLSKSASLKDAIEWQAKALASGEPEEGVAAFREKREPHWLK
jgi:enoyl-CoA hydratase/carnithine racemase